MIVGSDEALYTILESSLEKYPALVARRYYYDNAQVKLPNADSDVAHTLAHYVSTGEYQTLKTWDDSVEETYATEHRRGLQTYCASRHYQLHGLDELAKEKVLSLSDSIPVLTALGHIKSAFTAVSDDDWLPAYLDHMLEKAFETDDAVFTADELADHVGAEPTFDQALVRSLGRLLRDSLSSPDEAVPEHWEGNTDEAVPISLGEEEADDAQPWQNGASKADESASEHTGDWGSPRERSPARSALDEHPEYPPVEAPAPSSVNEAPPDSPEPEPPTEGYSPIPEDLDAPEELSPPPPPAPDVPAAPVDEEAEVPIESYRSTPIRDEADKAAAEVAHAIDEMEKLEPRSYQSPARSPGYRSVAAR